MKAVVFEQFGEPSEVLRVREVPIPEPGPGEVRVRMIASPVNPSDLLVVRGRYGVLPSLPSTPGFEGVGVVDKVGSGLLGWLVKGKRVTVINHKGGNWAEYAVIPARQARPVANDIPDEQVASFFVNPATVLAMARHVLVVPKGEWLLQSAAGSVLGRMMIKLGRHDGFKTINVVRRREAMAELQALGGDAVISSSDGPIDTQVRKIVGSDGVKYAIDPVGGETGTGVFQSLAADGRMLVYGTLSQQPLQIDPRLMIAGKRVVEGFWLGHWMRERSIPSALRLFREIANLIRADVLATEIGKSFPIDAIGDAVREAEQVGRHGKVLLQTGNR
ncbi:NADPH:quinone reductase [Singulisphaera sp. GP187]|uniref:zinc-dependent alcohol dehydrogenase family protein n=1 Tax=Singulisphaera sp. GP187 TaxID=1882752 RepID=UPI000925B64C|nr:zinc-dependent alcohol dehydrogenase family protein [Singulisphaera sp. GP187]SIO06281.1 NADPH:quinone reductase [Singulisphaera sp. GP187]